MVRQNSSFTNHYYAYPTAATEMNYQTKYASVASGNSEITKIQWDFSTTERKDSSKVKPAIR